MIYVCNLCNEVYVGIYYVKLCNFIINFIVKDRDRKLWNRVSVIIVLVMLF